MSFIDAKGYRRVGSKNAEPTFSSLQRNEAELPPHLPPAGHVSTYPSRKGAAVASRLETPHPPKPTPPAATAVGVVHDARLSRCHPQQPKPVEAFPKPLDDDVSEDLEATSADQLPSSLAESRSSTEITFGDSSGHAFNAAQTETWHFERRPKNAFTQLPSGANNNTCQPSGCSFNTSSVNSSEASVFSFSHEKRPPAPLEKVQLPTPTIPRSAVVPPPSELRHTGASTSLRGRRKRTLVHRKPKCVIPDAETDEVYGVAVRTDALDCPLPTPEIEAMKKPPVVIMCQVPAFGEALLNKQKPLPSISRKSVIERKKPVTSTTGFQRDEPKPGSRYERYLKKYEEEESLRQRNKDSLSQNVSVPPTNTAPLFKTTIASTAIPAAAPATTAGGSAVANAAASEPMAHSPSIPPPQSGQRNRRLRVSVGEEKRNDEVETAVVMDSGRKRQKSSDENVEPVEDPKDEGSKAFVDLKSLTETLLEPISPSKMNAKNVGTSVAEWIWDVLKEPSLWEGINNYEGKTSSSIGMQVLCNVCEVAPVFLRRLEKAVEGVLESAGDSVVSKRQQAEARILLTFVGEVLRCWVQGLLKRIDVEVPLRSKGYLSSDEGSFHLAQLLVDSHSNIKRLQSTLNKAHHVINHFSTIQMVSNDSLEKLLSSLSMRIPKNEPLSLCSKEQLTGPLRHALISRERQREDFSRRTFLLNTLLIDTQLDKLRAFLLTSELQAQERHFKIKQQWKRHLRPTENSSFFISCPNCQAIVPRPNPKVVDQDIVSETRRPSRRSSLFATTPGGHVVEAVLPSLSRRSSLSLCCPQCGEHFDSSEVAADASASGRRRRNSGLLSIEGGGSSLCRYLASTEGAQGTPSRTSLPTSPQNSERPSIRKSSSIATPPARLSEVPNLQKLRSRRYTIDFLARIKKPSIAA